MNFTPDKYLSLITEGKSADIVYQSCVEFIRTRHDHELRKLKSLFRDGKNDPITLSSGISAMCALDDLESDLKKKVMVGRNASAKLSENKES